MLFIRKRSLCYLYFINTSRLERNGHHVSKWFSFWKLDYSLCSTNTCKMKLLQQFAEEMCGLLCLCKAPKKDYRGTKAWAARLQAWSAETSFLSAQHKQLAETREEVLASLTGTACRSVDHPRAVSRLPPRRHLGVANHQVHHERTCGVARRHLGD